MESKTFNYENTEVKQQMGGSKVVRKVSIKKGKGYKSVTKYHKGKKVGTMKKPIHKSHIQLIQLGTFIPGLFADCKCNRKTRKNRK
jgi:amino acid permease